MLGRGMLGRGMLGRGKLGREVPLHAEGRIQIILIMHVVDCPPPTLINHAGV